MLLSKINDLKHNNLASKKRQNVVKFWLKILQKCKSLTLLTMHIIHNSSYKVFLQMQVLTNKLILQAKWPMTRTKTALLVSHLSVSAETLITLNSGF